MPDYLERQEKEALTSRYLQFRAPDKDGEPKRPQSTVDRTPEKPIIDNLLRMVNWTWKWSKVAVVNVVAQFVPDKNDVIFNEPSPSSVLANYGRVDVHESHSGHVIIVDDTEGNERIIHQHRNKSYTAMLADGDAVRKTMKDLYHYVGDPKGDNQGNWFINVNGHQVEVIQGDNRIVIEASREVNIKKDQIVSINGNQEERVLSNRYVNIGDPEGSADSSIESKLVFGDDGQQCNGHRTEVTLKDKAVGIRGHLKEKVDKTTERKVDGFVKETFGATWDVTAKGRIHIHSDTEVKVTAPVINLN